MKKFIFINNTLIWGICLMAIGLFVFLGITDSIRYLGIIFLIGALFLFVRYYLSNFNNSVHGEYKSRTREQLLKHQNKRY